MGDPANPASAGRLAGAVSPYLRQHAGNPVDWYPWGEEAQEAARRQDKPLFVSVGYAACHWCHVMAHESFEDPAVAADLDRWFVSVKVDREERPDVDALYMAAVQAMNGSGGWPMSVWCTPDGRPFFAGTYFPPTDRHGLPAFRRVLAALADAWATRRDEVERQADALAQAVRDDAGLLDRLDAARTDAGSVGGPAGRPVLDRLVDELAGRFDPEWGGFGPAPKFPRPTLVELCLRHNLLAGDARSLDMAVRTLDAMAAGGIYDHLAGGFARYSTDGRWLVPHFEKMLSDQALLARAYLHAWQVTGNPDYRQVLAETLDAAWEELGDAHGTLGSSLDADAAGVEGAHATWTPDEVAGALRAAGLGDMAEEVCAWYGVGPGGNFEGRTVLHRPLGAGLGRPAGIEAARKALLEERRSRPQPQRDDKVLTEWNALYVAALAEAAAACGSEAWAARAEAVMESLAGSNRRADGRWLRARSSPVLAFAADLAWVVEAATRLAELTGKAAWVAAAQEAAGQLLDHHWDDRRGGLYSAAHDAPGLIARAKDVLDGAMPSAASAGAWALLRLGALTGWERAAEAGARLVAMDGALIEGQPQAVADMVGALLFAEDHVQVVVAGERPDLLEVVRSRWRPGAVVAWGEPGPSPLWEARPPGAAYVCRRFVCQAPAHDAATLAAQLAGTSAGPR